MFRRALQERRCAFLDQILSARKVLILGDGDGRFVARFLKLRARLTDPVTVDLVDISPGMMILAQKRIARIEGFQGEINLQVSDVHTARLDGIYDLIVTHFFFDCFSTMAIRDWMNRVANHTAPGTRWLNSEFAIPKQSPWRSIGHLLIRTMYLFFRLTAGLQTSELPNYRAILTSHGFVLTRGEGAGMGLLISELWTKTR